MINIFSPQNDTKKNHPKNFELFHNALYNEISKHTQFYRMKILGIELVPLNTPLEKRIQTLVAGVWFFTLVFGGFIGLLIAIYLIVFTPLRWLTVLYVLWTWLVDSKIAERGGRPLEFMKNFIAWKYLMDYFPIRMEKASDSLELDPKKNYLFCYFPHGLLPVGPFSQFSTNHGQFQELFPHHKRFCVTLGEHFRMPFFRELVLGLGAVSTSAASINFLMSDPRGGNAAALVVGGASESYYSFPGQYNILLNKRKGFIKLALRNGTPLVPCIGFGEPELFNQVYTEKGSLLRRLQEFIRQYTGLALVIPVGRGFFQTSFGLIPRSHPVHFLGKYLVVKTLKG